MSDSVLMVLIVAVAVVVGLFMFRRQLSRFFLKANRKGLAARLETRDPGTMVRELDSVTISGNQQIGTKNTIETERSNVNVTDNLQLGERQTIAARPGSSVRNRKR
jgi:hypothetical protein